MVTRDPATSRIHVVCCKVNIVLKRRLKAEAKKLKIPLSLHLATILEQSTLTVK